MDRQVGVLEETLQRLPLVARVGERLGDRGLVEDLLDLLVAPREELLDDNPRLPVAGLGPLLARRGRYRTLDVTDRGMRSESVRQT